MSLLKSIFAIVAIVTTLHPRAHAARPGYFFPRATQYNDRFKADSERAVRNYQKGMLNSGQIRPAENMEIPGQFNGWPVEKDGLTYLVAPASVQEIKDLMPRALQDTLNAADARFSKSPNYKALKDSAITSAGSMRVRFVPEAITFYSGVGAISFYQCYLAMKNDPMACDRFFDSLNLMEGAVFGAFVFSSGMARVFAGYKFGWSDAELAKRTAFRQIIPKSALSALGLAAGAFVTHYLHEFLIDPDIRYVALNMGNLKTPIDREIWMKHFTRAAEHWMAGAGINQLSRSISSMTLALLGTTVSNITLKYAGAGVTATLSNLIRRRIGIEMLRKTGERVVLQRLAVSFGLNGGRLLLGGVRVASSAFGMAVQFLLMNSYFETKINYLMDTAGAIQKMKVQENGILQLLAQSIYLQQRSPTNPWEQAYKCIRYYLGYGSDTDCSLRIRAEDLPPLKKPSIIAREMGQTESVIQKLKSLEEQSLLPLTPLILAPRPEAPMIGATPSKLETTPQDKPSDLESDYWSYGLRTSRLPQAPSWHMKISSSQYGVKQNTPYYVAIADMLDKHAQHTDSYLHALSAEFDTVVHNWMEFFGNMNSKISTFRNFYRAILSSKDQIAAAPPSLKASTSLLDSVDLGLYSLPAALKVHHDIRRIQVEAASIGLSYEFIFSRSPEALAEVVKTIKSKSSDEWGSASTYLNHCFDRKKLSTYGKYDFQIRLRAISYGLEPKYLEALSTDGIEWFINFLGDKSTWEVPYFVKAFNQGIGVQELARLTTTSQIVKLFGGPSQFAIQSDVASDLQLKISEFCGAQVPEAPSPLIEPSENKFYGFASDGLSGLHEGYAISSTADALVYDMACSTTHISDYKNLIGRRSTFGRLDFKYPRLTYERSTSCGGRSTVHAPFNRYKNGFKTYNSLLDYLVNNLNEYSNYTQNNAEVFDKVWIQDNILSEADKTYDEYKEDLRTALREKLEPALYRQGTIFARPLAVMDGLIFNRRYEAGVRNATLDAVNYYFRVITLVFPRTDKELSEDLLYFLEGFRVMSDFVAQDFDQVYENYREGFLQPSWDIMSEKFPKLKPLEEMSSIERHMFALNAVSESIRRKFREGLEAAQYPSDEFFGAYIIMDVALRAAERAVMTYSQIRSQNIDGDIWRRPWQNTSH